MVGALPAAVISDRFGRRWAMFSGAVLIIVGTVVSATAEHVAQFVVGRFILGYGITHMSLAAPAFAMEIAPPQWRGRCAGGLSRSDIECHAEDRSFELWLVWRFHPCCSHHLWNQLYRQQLFMENTHHLARIRLYRRHLYRLFHPRITSMANGQW